ncbi:MAG: kinase/pyrophosphorylase [Kiritimatiellia bacterium]
MTTRRKKPVVPPPGAPSPAYTLHILSDATGNLARHMINAVLTQFPDIVLAQNYHLMLDQPAKVRDELKRIQGTRSIVFHAMIEPGMKRIVDETCEKRGIPHYDLTGSLVRFLADWTGTEPINERAALHRVNAGYFKRIDAMEFTATHDDSQGLDTSTSPTSSSWASAA